MPLEIVCDCCGALLYIGVELRSPREVLKQNGGRCKKCDSLLSYKEFNLDISPLREAFLQRSNLAYETVSTSI